MEQLQVWGGFECTANRVRNTFIDQFVLSGHRERIGDLDLLVDLGIRTVRYPILWERFGNASEHEWEWADERLERLRALGIRVIAGLLHHGSGPMDTSLVDDDFPERFADYALRVAERYPWIEDYTPINEPLTTARFSCLYGHWYPHCQCDLRFAKAFCNQILATQKAMQRVRSVNPNASLIQTEDLGKTYGRPALSNQVRFENLRRWATFDALTGKLRTKSGFGKFLVDRCQVEPQCLEQLTAQATPPNVLGINYYVTSERFLDDRLELYPTSMHGGNDKRRYVDVEAVRVRHRGIAGHYRILREAWERYGIPLALTEVHLACTREEQVRWFAQAWDAGTRLLKEGVDFRAVTAWSLLGAYEWDSLITKQKGYYECGAFDLRGGAPRATRLARLVRSLATHGENQMPEASMQGWWERPVRFNVKASRPSASFKSRSMAPVLITGASGTLGSALVRICDVRGLPYVSLSRQELDICDPQSIEHCLRTYRPWALINAAGYVRVDDAQVDAERCMAINADGPRVLAKLCQRRGVRFATFSSDLVFDGKKGSLYLESDSSAPLNVYGVSKAEAEKFVMANHEAPLVIRTSAFFGPWDKHNFPYMVMRCLRDREPFQASSNTIVSATYVPDLVNATLDLLLDDESGIWHVTNKGALSWSDLALQVARTFGLDHHLVQSCSSESLGLSATRPPYSALGSERAYLLPPVDCAIDRFKRQLAVSP